MSYKTQNWQIPKDPMSIHVNPEILVWARQSAGFGVDEAASKLGFKDTLKATADQKLEALETGEKQPSRSQLSKFATIYKRPLVTFYLSEPPRKGTRGNDFRQTPDARSVRDNAMLDTLLRNVKARQEMVRDILLDDDNLTSRHFVGSATVEIGANALVELIAKELNFNHIDPNLRKGDSNSLFGRLREAAEAAGIFVIIASDLGSHHSTIAASVFRGFAIADKVAPFVVINGKDAQPARSFTLLHELAHIWLGQTGVSGGVSTVAPTNANANIERFCNDVAGEFLLPDEQFNNGVQPFDKSDLQAAQIAIDVLASLWSVSEAMVAYRLMRRNELTREVYQTLNSFYAARWSAKLKHDRAKRGDESLRISGHVIRQHRLGNAFVSLVQRGLREKTLTHTKAATLLGSKPGSVEPFIRQFEDKQNRRSSRSGNDS